MTTPYDILDTVEAGMEVPSWGWMLIGAIRERLMYEGINLKSRRKSPSLVLQWWAEQEYGRGAEEGR